MDIVSAETRSRMMSGIRTRDTKPEVLFRKGLHRRGYRYRLQSKHVPGKPDFVLPKYRVAAFVHGCFWHRHGCHLFKWPRTRPEFWRAKLDRNRERDDEVAQQVNQAGWRQLTVWECALRGRHQIGLGCALNRAERWFLTSEPRIEIRGTK